MTMIKSQLNLQLGPQSEPACLKLMQDSMILMQDWIRNQTNVHFEIKLGVTLVTSEQ